MSQDVYRIVLCLRRKGQKDYEHIGIIDLDEPLRSSGQVMIRLPGGKELRASIDANHLIPIHSHQKDNPPLIFASEL